MSYHAIPNIEAGKDNVPLYQLLAKSVEDTKNSLASSSDLGCIQHIQKFHISRPCPADPEEALATYNAEAIRASTMISVLLGRLG